MNNCEGIESLWIDYLDGALSAEERARVEQHLADCARCSTELRAHARIREAYAGVEERAPDPAVVQAVLQRARAEVEPGRSVPVTWRVLWGTLAAVAALILGLVLVPRLLNPRVSLERAEALAEQGSHLQVSGDWSGAAECFRAALEAHPGGPSAARLHHGLGYSWLRAEQPGLALLSLELVLQEFPGYELRDRALLESGEALEALGKIPEAIRTYDLLVREFPHERGDAEARIQDLQLSEEVVEELQSMGYVGD